MTHFRSRALVLLVLLFLSVQLTYAQQNSSKIDENADAALREKAFNLLESLAGQLSTLQSAENRARMGSNIAESLWVHNEKRARALLQLVEDDIKLGLQRQHNDPDSERTFQVFLKLREDHVHRIAKHDPKLALSFLRETLPFIQEAARRPGGEFPDRFARQEQALELRLAKRLGASEPAVAIQLARQSLEHGLSEDLLLLLVRLSRKNKDQAQILHKEIITKLNDADFTHYYPVVHFAQQLAGKFTPPAADESTYRELMNVLLTKAFALGCEKVGIESEERTSLCVYIGAMMPLVEKYYPAQARRLMHWAPEDWQFKVSPVTSAYVELDELSENGTIDEILALASEYPQLEGQVYLRAMARAERDGDVDRARKIAGSYAGDPSIRRTLLDRMAFYDVSESRLEQQLAQAQKDLFDSPPLRQATLLYSLAANAAPYNRTFAMKVLDQVNGLIETLPAGENRAHLQIATALVYCLARDDRGFRVMESLLPTLNELIAAAAKLDRYDTRYLRDGEWNMSGAGSVGKILTLLANNAQHFAWHDFDRAMTLTSQFERAEIRMMAQLKLAQGILAGRPKHLPFRPLMY